MRQLGKAVGEPLGKHRLSGESHVSLEQGLP